LSEFEPLVASPLLIPHVRNPGGQGGRRITAGRLDGEWALAVDESVTEYGSPLALVHAFNAALRDAGRVGLTSRPEPIELTVDALRAAEQAL
jgi:hypothetical protein